MFLQKACRFPLWFDSSIRISDYLARVRGRLARAKLGHKVQSSTAPGRICQPSVISADRASDKCDLIRGRIFMRRLVETQ